VNVIPQVGLVEFVEITFSQNTHIVLVVFVSIAAASNLVSVWTSGRVSIAQTTREVKLTRVQALTSLEIAHGIVAYLADVYGMTFAQAQQFEQQIVVDARVILQTSRGKAHLASVE
jgi:hypothetical protein